MGKGEHYGAKLEIRGFKVFPKSFAIAHCTSHNYIFINWLRQCLYGKKV
ncbi:MAG: hypothetical protein V7K23_13040 [Nostoc sp.]